MQNKIQTSIEAAYHNLNIKMEDIIGIMKQIQKACDIDKIMVVTNRDYKYQLNHVLTCKIEMVEVHKPITFSLTSAEYEEKLRIYQKDGTSEVPFHKIDLEGSFIHAGIVREDELFGIITFWNENKKEWSEEEKQYLKELCRLMLLFIGMNNLVHGVNHYQQAVEEFQNDLVVAGFFVNMRTKEIRAMKLPEGMKSVFPEWGEYDALLRAYAQKYVEGSYEEQLLAECGFDIAKKSLTKNHPTLSTEFPRLNNGKMAWVRYRIQGHHFDADGNPAIAIATFTDITEEMKERAYLFGASNVRQNMYTTIITLNLNTEQYAVCVDNRREDSITDSFELCGRYSQIREEIHPDVIEKAQEEQLDKMFDRKYLIEHFDQSDEPLCCDFSSILNGSPYWVRFQIMKGSDYSTEKRTVMLYYSDVTDVKKQEISMIETREQLEQDNRKKKYLLEHDQLTGVYNRHGFDEIIGRLKNDSRPIAYAQIDVDKFKKINDTYGHGVGDEVLVQVAQQLVETFRADDYVFRYGGDEFAVLMTNCRKGGWKNIGDKQQMLHIQLNQILKKGIYVTLSMGISWSHSGFTEDMITLADAALYQVKNNGRAGCCIFDKESHILYQWKDEIEDSSEGNVLEENNTGACRVELPNDDTSKGRLICNETSRAIMGFDESMTPEECYQAWEKRVDPYYKETLEKAHKVLLEKGQVECTYLYHHPIMGPIMVRSGGKGLRNKEGVVFYGYHQSLQDTRIVLHEDDSQKLIDAMTGLYFASYYIDLREDWYCIFKSTAESRHLEKQEIPASVAIKSFVQTLVKPEYREIMNEFVDLKTLADRLQDRQYVEAEYHSMVEEKGWCRIRLLAVRRDENGVVTHVQLLVASIDKEKKAQLEREEAIRNAMKLQLRVGEIVAQTTIQHVGLIDRKTGITNIYMNGMISRDAIEVSFDEMRQWGMQHVYELDRALIDKQFNLEYIENEIEKNGSCVMTFRQAEESGKISTLIHHYEISEIDPSKILAVIENVASSSLKGKKVL